LSAAAFILAAHGSRLASANDEVRALAARLSEILGHPIRAAFLELALPSIADAIESAAKDSPSEILILPYFLTQGKHVLQDIPAIIAAEAERFPKLKMRLLPYLGQSEGWAEQIAERIRSNLF